MHEITSDVIEVMHFVKSIMYLPAAEGMHGLGLKKDGEMVAGVLYEACNGKNVWAHIAAVPTKRWMTKQFLLAIFDFQFNVLGVDRVSAYVESKNFDSLRINRNFGFKVEAVLEGAASDGGNLILFVMWKKDCKYVHPKQA